jgi:hypothetical protein
LSLSYFLYLFINPEQENINPEQENINPKQGNINSENINE